MTNNNRDINYVSHGEGPVVILIHGLAASLQDWAAFIPSLVSKGYRAIALDLLGHGESAKPEDARHYHIETLYAVLRDWIEGLNLSGPPLLVGHSLGGYLSLAYARRHPEKVRGMALIDPFYSPEQLSPVIRYLRKRPEMGVRAMQLAPEWIFRTFLRLDPTGTAQFSRKAQRQILEDYRRASPNILHITRSVPDLTPELPRVKHPALVLYGDKDLTLNPKSFTYLADRLPNATSVRISDCGHQPHIGRPEEVERHLVKFLEQIEESAGERGGGQGRKKIGHGLDGFDGYPRKFL
jgi:pimeloyl-ACP methyl ester carboxylesterase